jgi:predicted ATP-grasp superfamily ATP-dependent carboligase
VDHTLQLDRSVPALLVKVGKYPAHHGHLGAIRSLGRAGVPVYLTTESRRTPAALSRFVTERLDWRTDGHEDAAQLVEKLRRVGEHIGRPAVPYATDDESAVLLAEHREALSEHFLLPDIPPELPRWVSSKRGLFELCQKYAIPTPQTLFPTTVAELVDAGRSLGYPLVAKNIEPFTRLVAAAVPGSTIIRSEDELLARFATGERPPSLLLQEYLPKEHSEDYFVHYYRPADGVCRPVVIGRKLRSWPPFAGLTTYGYSVDHDELTELSTQIADQTGWRGIGDFDWRYDRRTGRYHLVDFNPRMGAQTGLGQSTTGLTVLHALHLEMTGRPVPFGSQTLPRRFIVENFDFTARRAYHKAGTTVPPVPPGTRPVYGWWAKDDPIPFAGMITRAALRIIRDRLRAAAGWLHRGD